MNHKKFIDCPDCGGHGFITQPHENGQTSVLCMKCQGIGSVAVPMTNADRIRAMSDEELAKFISGVVGSCAENSFYSHCIPCKISHCDCSICLQWLQQPAEEDDHGV